MNNLNIIGNLGADPDVRKFDSGTLRVNLALYYNERYTDKDGQTQERTSRFTVEAWGQPAEFAANYLHKGSKVAVSGSLSENTWTDAEGQNRSRVIVRAKQIENLTPKPADEPEAVEDDF